MLGFSLLELAVALTLLSLLMGWLVTPLRVQRTLMLSRETDQRLQQAQQALIGHAIILHYLPCPDTDMPPDGWENMLSNQGCASTEGVLPWQQLGVVATDAWGRFFRYRADNTFTHHGVWFSIGDAESASTLQVTGEAGASTSSPSRPVAILLSHGENGLGGIQSGSDGQAVAMPGPSHPDEVENADADTMFIERAYQQGNGLVYDDRLLMLSPKVLIAAMVQAQRLP